MNISRGRLGLLLCAATFAASWTDAVRASTEGATLQGRRFVSGGVTQEERDALASRRGAYTVMVVTAARNSGAYPANVQVTVRDEAGRTVLETRLDGPWLFVDLDRGRHAVHAVFGAEAQEKAVAITGEARREVCFYFDAEAVTLPPAASR
jgi:hypothetical protein